MLNFLRGGGNTAPEPSASEIVEMVAQDRMVLIDIRDAAEVASTGKAKGALTIPMPALRFQADRKGPDYNPAIDPDKPIALYCASGARSWMAARMLRSMGYGRVHNLGSLGAWNSGGGAIVR